MANKSDLDAAVERAAKAQPEWAAVNPQRRARVMMKYVSLLHRDMDTGHDPHVDVLPGYRLRQCDDPKALRAGSIRAQYVGRTDD